MTYENSVADERSWIQGLGGLSFFVLCSVCSLLAGTLGFLVFGLTATAAKASDGVMLLACLSGVLLGLFLPTYALRKKRRSAYREPVAAALVSKSDPPMYASTSPAAAPTQEPIDTRAADDGTQWFYSDNGKRIGPISWAGIQALVTKRTIGRKTQVWRKGYTDWRPLGETELADQVAGDQPPPLSHAQIGNGFAWALTFAPLWASALHYAGCYAYLSLRYGLFFEPQLDALVAKTFYVFWGLNAILALYDEHALKAAGVEGANKLSNWLTFIVPVYIYKRDQLVEAGATRFLIWMVCFFISLLPIWF